MQLNIDICLPVLKVHNSFGKLIVLPSTSVSFSCLCYFNEIYQRVFVEIRRCCSVIIKSQSCTHLTSLKSSSCLKDHAVPCFSNTHPYNHYACLSRILLYNLKNFAVQFPPIQTYSLPRLVTQRQCNYHILGTFFQARQLLTSNWQVNAILINSICKNNRK